MNDDNAREQAGKLGLSLLAAKAAVVDPEPEDVKLSCHIQKLNKHGLKQTRSLMITQKGIYNITKKKTNWKINRAIEIHSVEAMTLCQPAFAARSAELLIHVAGEYDYRYVAPLYKNTLVNIVRKAVNRQVQLGLREAQCQIYQVDRANLKKYATLKTEARDGIFRRPGSEFLVDDHMFEKTNEE